MVRKIIFGLVILILTACAVSPTGRKQFLMMSPQQLDVMGTQSFVHMKHTKPVVKGSQVNQYVLCVARAILAEAPGNQSWEVAVFRDDAVNAFAVPGGKIGVNTGLLKVARNQDQLAAVIGHEVGHVIANHANERLSQQYAVQGGLMVIDALAGNYSSPATRQMAMQALGLGAEIGILLPYSRIHESEADLVGLKLMAEAGFDPRESITLWRNMASAGGRQTIEFLSTHPSDQTRLQDLGANMAPAAQIYETARSQGKRPHCEEAG